MSVAVVRLLLASLLVVGRAGWADGQGANLSSLYESIFRGSRKVHVPSELLEVSPGYRKVASIELRGGAPFDFGYNQGYFFPTLTNEDESSLYFDPYYGFGPLHFDASKMTPVRFALRYDKKTQTTETARIEELGEYLREKVYGFYKNLRSQSDGVVRIDAENSWAFVAEGKKATSYDIMNPKDLDSGTDSIFLSRFQVTESRLPYMRARRDMELLVYSKSEKRVLKGFTLPFTDSYFRIGTGTVPLQSVAGSNLVYLVLFEPMLRSPIVVVPKEPRRWHLLIYDFKEDALYSAWHGMDESDHLPALSFSYYLGQEGLYFEVLKEAKIEIYLLDIDLKKATPLKEYETVDLLWNNKGLRGLWQQKIGEAKLKDPSFDERWE